MREIDVVGAVIVEDGQVLCAKRGQAGTLAGLWEFPGGKVETDETPEGALVREIREELGCSVEVGEKITTTVHVYDFGAVTLTTYYCRLLEGTPTSGEHESICWLPAEDLQTLQWAPADIPAVELVAAALA